jgi:serine phosphatase RsbU (regulator of sigma subunit)
MRKILFGSFTLLSFLILILAVFQNYQLKIVREKQAEIKRIEQEINCLSMFKSEQLAVYYNPIYWDTIQPTSHFCQDFDNTTQHQIHNIEKSLAAIGYKENGFVGKLRDFAHALENDSRFSTTILSLRRIEKDYLLRKDSTAAKAFYATIKNINNKDTTLIAYANTFETIEKIYDTLFLSKNSQVLSLDKFITTSLNNKKEEMRERSEEMFSFVTSTSRKNMLFSGFLIALAVSLSFFFSVRLSKSIIELQRKMKKYILSEYDSNIRFDEKIPNNELGSIMIHFIQLTKKITQDIHTLEARVKRRTKTIEEKHAQLEQQHEEILQSMRYAKDIQRSLLPNTKELQRLFPEFQLFFQPKELVGGDFYWGKQVFDNGIEYRFLAVADCTGHGIPGALLGTLGIHALDEIIQEKIYEPGELLNHLRWYLSKRLNKNARQVQDGMDIAILCHNITEQKITFAGANMDCWIIRDSNLLEIKGDRMFVGWSNFVTVPFQTIEIEVERADQLLLFSDGLIDQFGGENDKKWGKKRLRDFAIEHAVKQNFLQNLEISFNNWKNKNEQTDDCTVLYFQPNIIVDEKKTEKRSELLTHFA